MVGHTHSHNRAPDPFRAFSIYFDAMIWKRRGLVRGFSSAAPVLVIQAKLEKSGNGPRRDRACVKINRNRSNSTPLASRRTLFLLVMIASAHLRAATEIAPPPPPVIPTATFDITAFGAVGDGKTMNTLAFARAISACRLAGGGSVIVPPGVFLTGPFALASHMALVVEKGATIQASSRFKDFGLPDPLPTIQDQLDALRPSLHPLISGSKLTDVAIRGEGTIDGAGLPWWQRTARPAYNPTNAPLLPRPNMIVLTRCNRVEVSGVTLQNSPMFHLVPKLCSNVLIDGIKIRAPSDAANTDAIDPSNCSTMLIRRVYTDTGDDNIAFKAGHDGPSRDITVTDCSFKHGHGVSIGSETDGGVSNILVQRCAFEDGDSAIRIKTARGKGGVIDDVTYRDITMKNVGKAIDINLYYEDKADAANPKAEPVTGKTPRVRNILIQNITCDNAKSAGEITGLPEASATNIVLDNVSISASTGLAIQDATGLQFKSVSFTTAPAPSPSKSGEAIPSNLIPAAKNGKLTVAADGSGDSKTIQQAVNAAPDLPGNGKPFLIHIKPGTYTEVVNIPKTKGPIDFQGGSAADTTITFANGASTLDENGNQLGTFRSATVFVGADDFTAENITFQNTFVAHAQALAVNVAGDRDTFRNCRFLGWQDTVFLRQGRQYFEDCDISGAVDFIFGGATAWFEKCRINCIGSGYITAANTPQSQPYGFIFDHCAISGSPGVTSYLGRPWRAWASVTYLSTTMASVIAPGGWQVWNQTDNHKTARYSEWNSAGPGANPTARVPWSRQLTEDQASAIAIPEALDGWIPPGFPARQ